MASSNPRDYNTEHWALWQQYADRLLAYFTGNGPNPGEPPAGYREVYCVHHRHAPLPEHRAGGPPTSGGAGGWGSGMRGVAMSEDAFRALLSQGTQWATAFSQLAQSMRGGPGPVAIARPAPIPVAPRSYYTPAKTWHGNQRGRGGYHSGRGRPQGRGGSLLGRMGRNLSQGAKNGRGAHNRGKRAGRDRRDDPPPENDVLDARGEQSEDVPMAEDAPRDAEQDITTTSEEADPTNNVPADTDDSVDEEDPNGWGRLEM
ncbi:hypothetical protein BD311DRAFT_805736 [Dichomitus squalens]|uniref:Uncharacterized protein n=1 Tax=Dichomitus squalens TaxID=114155 RepID=A0A4Q9MQV4_9APHY|nr:hypothetical protein BD311DRAFT_805736 [Dichomitus squalens]